jgi:hypothetical protein
LDAKLYHFLYQLVTSFFEAARRILRLFRELSAFTIISGASVRHARVAQSRLRRSTTDYPSKEKIMIVVTHEFTCPIGEHAKAEAVTKEYKELFDPSPSCRIYTSVGGRALRFFIEDDFENLGDYEVKWAERSSTPEFQTWLKKWFEIAIDGSFEVNFRRVIE